MLTGLKHTHTLLVTLFLVSLLIKSFLLLSGNKTGLAAYRKKTMVVEMIITVLFLGTGIAIASMIGWGNMKAMGWFHVKLGLVLVAIPIGIIGFKKENKFMVALGLLIFVYIFILAFTKNPLLIF